MTWTRLSSDWADRPDLLGVSRSARLLHIEAIIWCNRQLTGGALPRAALRRLTDSPDPDADAAELVSVGLWTEVPAGWLVDWTDQEPPERVRERMAFAAARQARYKERGERHAQGDHSLCTSRCPHRARNASANGSRDASLMASLTPYPIPSDPFPSIRDGNGSTGAGAPSAGAPGTPRPTGDTTSGADLMERVAKGKYVFHMPPPHEGDDT